MIQRRFKVVRHLPNGTSKTSTHQLTENEARKAYQPNPQKHPDFINFRLTKQKTSTEWQKNCQEVPLCCQVDVVMSAPGSGGSPFDFLARFAGPIAWLIAGLLLLFGGLCLGWHWGFNYVCFFFFEFPVGGFGGSGGRFFLKKMTLKFWPFYRFDLEFIV